MRKVRLFTKLAVLAAMALPLTAHSDPIGFDFYQDGFDENASIIGMFFGEDLNNDGQLAYFPGSPVDNEIFDFKLFFTGNGLVSAFTLGFDELFGLVYDLDGGPLGDGLFLAIEGIAAGDISLLYLAGPGPFELCGTGEDCSVIVDFATGNESYSQNFVVISREIPEPGTLALLGIGLVGIGLARRRKMT